MNQANETDTDGDRLRKKFITLKKTTGMNKAEFARTYKVPGGASMISQHISGHRPIGLDAVSAYIKGFNCSVADISPTLAAQLPQQAPPADTSQANGAPYHTGGTRSLGMVIKEPDVIHFEDAVRVLAEHLMPLDEAARRRIAPTLTYLCSDPADHRGVAKTLLAIIESSKRRAA